MKQLTKVMTIKEKIYLFRGHRVMLDSDLAKLYGVRVKVLIQAVKRNLDRFPGDFMFQLSLEEARFLRSQFVTLEKLGRGRYRKYMPYVFNEQGVAMLSGILNSKRAIQVNIAIMRAFVKLREIFLTHRELAHKLAELERKTERHDEEIKAIFTAIRKLMAPPEKSKRRIGFHT